MARHGGSGVTCKERFYTRPGRMQSQFLRAESTAVRNLTSQTSFPAFHLRCQAIMTDSTFTSRVHQLFYSFPPPKVKLICRSAHLFNPDLNKLAGRERAPEDSSADCGGGGLGVCFERKRLDRSEEGLPKPPQGVRVSEWQRRVCVCEKGSFTGERVHYDRVHMSAPAQPATPPRSVLT